MDRQKRYRVDMEQKVIAHCIKCLIWIVDICVKSECTLQQETIKNHVKNLLETVKYFSDDTFINFSDKLILANILNYIHVDLQQPGNIIVIQ